MFKYAVSLVADNSKEKVAAKLEFFKRTLGCSESELSIAISKMPRILGISDENLTCKIEFLVNEVGMEPQYILERPVLLGYSLEKTYFTLANMVDAFILKFIDCHQDSVPGLAAYYAKACAGDVPPEVQLLS
ncbi:hypothetical protein SETIT_4G098400v2 [Setaria italica]|uniref:Uncharacterized protein n=1 Tax=Setaria italica TaxID=4555 RepID=A0A368QUI0_SETIT|nr:hypothetical protein SETIT_4G098400v2 [Setaria italica]